MKTKELCTNGKRLLAVALAIGVIGAAHAFQPMSAALPGAQVSSVLATFGPPGKECGPYVLDVNCSSMPTPSLIPPIIPVSPPLPVPGRTAQPAGWLLAL